ncbi:MAG: CUB domain-containing protein, partial [Bacteroidetes bacterium]|nr:CUB domain-containing protein [Bacteroidota bacterium]
MKVVKTHYLFVLVCLLASSVSSAQVVPKFNMSDTTVNECKGQFFDSGGPNAIYKINEDLTFTICAGGPVSLTFSGLFCVEQGLDKLRFFNGPDTNSTQIGGTYSGTTSPGTIVASSGCLTIHFKSDLSVAYCGWSASWTTVIVPPVPPVFQITTPQCNDTELLLTLASGYRCDFILPGSFTVTGPVKPTVTTATALACNADSTTSIRLGLSKPLSENCTYTVKFDMQIYDNCDSLWLFTKYATVVINSCAYSVSIKKTSDSICGGTCTQLTAVPSATCFKYNYSWSHGLPPTAGPHSVCPLANTTYTVTIQEVNGGAAVTMTQLIVVRTPKITPLVSDTICQSDPPFKFTATPPKGSWSGIGILDTLSGFFHPDTAGPGVFYIKYKINNSCTDSSRIVIKELDAGFDDAACVGGPSFQVSGGLALGGTWSGSPFINATGFFTPSTTGTYTITYSHPNGCSESKKVFVSTLQLPLTIDTICQSIWFDSLSLYVSPSGGRFYGNGIVDSIYGVFVPKNANPGLQTITYKLGNGCSGTFKIFVKEINVEPYWSSCPTQGQIMLPKPAPPGGVWTGPGVNSSGLYDPAAGGISNHTNILLYNAPNGCQDTLIMDSYKTNIFGKKMFFCVSDSRLQLNRTNVDHFPTNGTWSGKGVTYDSSNKRYYFNPSISGAGTHTITYLKNTCSDTILMIVYPDNLSKDSITVCSSQSSFVIDPAVPPGAYWSGTGVNTSTGVFNPATSGNGTFKIKYNNPAGCRDSVFITVYKFQTAKINGLTNVYCMRDTNI